MLRMLPNITITNNPTNCLCLADLVSLQVLLIPQDFWLCQTRATFWGPTSATFLSGSGARAIWSVRRSLHSLCIHQSIWYGFYGWPDDLTYTESGMDRQSLRQQNPCRVKSEPVVIFKYKPAEGLCIRAVLCTILATAFWISS